MSESNDQAFIKVSQELLCLRNDLAGLELIKSFSRNCDHWVRDALKAHRSESVHSPVYAGLSKIISLMATPEGMAKEILRIKNRILQLDKLAEAYVLGKDIIQARLEMN